MTPSVYPGSRGITPTFDARTVWIIALTSLLICLLFGVLADAAQQARWHRYGGTKLDTTTWIDVVKDVYSQQCYAVYRVQEPGVDAQSDNAIMARSMVRPAVTALGPVPCEVGR